MSVQIEWTAADQALGEATLESWRELLPIEVLTDAHAAGAAAVALLVDAHVLVRAVVLRTLAAHNVAIGISEGAGLLGASPAVGRRARPLDLPVLATRAEQDALLAALDRYDAAVGAVRLLYNASRGPGLGAPKRVGAFGIVLGPAIKIALTAVGIAVPVVVGWWAVERDRANVAIANHAASIAAALAADLHAANLQAAAGQPITGTGTLAKALAQKERSAVPALAAGGGVATLLLVLGYQAARRAEAPPPRAENPKRTMRRRGAIVRAAEHGGLRFRG